MCITAENVHELLPAADQFNIEGIVFKCCKFLEENLEPENCIGVRNMSHSTSGRFSYKILTPPNDQQPDNASLLRADRIVYGVYCRISTFYYCDTIKESMQKYTFVKN